MLLLANNELPLLETTDLPPFLDEEGGISISVISNLSLFVLLFGDVPFFDD